VNALLSPGTYCNSELKAGDKAEENSTVVRVFERLPLTTAWMLVTSTSMTTEGWDSLRDTTADDAVVRSIRNSFSFYFVRYRAFFVNFFVRNGKMILFCFVCQILRSATYRRFGVRF
jgi:hypothetical protein